VPIDWQQEPVVARQFPLSSAKEAAPMSLSPIAAPLILGGVPYYRGRRHRMPRSLDGERARPAADLLAAALGRSAHPFLMWEGVSSVSATLRGSLRPERQGEVGRAAEALDGVQVVHLTGCGTSYFSAIAATYALPKIAGVPAVAHDAFEFAAYPPAGLDRAGFVAISHTGSTESVMAALSTARQRGAVPRSLPAPAIHQPGEQVRVRRHRGDHDHARRHRPGQEDCPLQQYVQPARV
jgi:hypothetical protein